MPYELAGDHGRQRGPQIPIVQTFNEADWRRLSINGNIGRTESVRFDADNPIETLPILEIRADDQAAREMTLTLQKFEPGPQLVAGNLEQFGQPYFARVEWGAGGFNNQAEVDFINGMTLRVNASYLRVVAHKDVVGAHGVGEQRLGAFVTPGHGRGGLAPQKSMAWSAAANSESARIPIPNFAYQFYLLAHRTGVAVPHAAPTGEVFVRRGNGNIEAKYDFDVGPVSNTAQVQLAMKIPNCGRFVSIFNEDAANAWSGWFVFDLAL